MKEIKLYNTLTRKKQEFIPIEKNKVGIYSCGPTVYWNQHIGHMFAYIVWDILVRFLKSQNYEVKWVMNITDVGHLTSDEDTGEDKMEKGAKREGLSVMEIAEKYTKQFLKSLDELNIKKPDILSKATEHIKEQIDLIKKIEEKGFTYQTKTGLVFDTSKFKDYEKFANLNLKEQEAGKRVDVDEEKKQPWDFLLWITNQPQHILKWESPWGVGFPGWHIECTAMSVKYLGKKFDIHTGGKEHIPVHHTNEVAQATAAFGEQTSNFWLHNEWVSYGGKKIAKSDPASMILIDDIKKKGYHPLSFRYLTMNSHYRKGLNFSWETMRGADNSLNNLYDLVSEILSEDKDGGKNNIKDSDLNSKNIRAWQDKFISALSDDLNTPQALATAWNMLKSENISSSEKIRLISDWDNILGLDILRNSEARKDFDIPDEVSDLLEKRKIARDSQDWKTSDDLRNELKKLGYKVMDRDDGQDIEKL